MRRFSTLVKKTPLYDLHNKLKPKYGNFAGYEMPMTFGINSTKEVVTGIRNESIGVFDISHMGIIKLKDNNKSNLKNLIETLFPINLKNLHENNSNLTILLNHDGKIQDDLIVSNLNNSEYRLLVNSATKYSILNLLQKYNLTTDIILEDKTILAIQGSKSSKLLEEEFDITLDEFYFNQNKFIKTPNSKIDLEISRTGYTGEDGFELYCENDFGRYFYDKLINLKNDKNIVFGGLIERDILRLEAGFCLSGKEFGKEKDIFYKDINMNFLIGKNRKESGNFIGSDNIIVQKYNRKGIYSNRPLKDNDIIYCNQTIVGYVTSSSKSYYLDKFISMAFIEKDTDLKNLYTIKNKKKFY